MFLVGSGPRRLSLGNGDLRPVDASSVAHILPCQNVFLNFPAEQWYWFGGFAQPVSVGIAAASFWSATRISFLP